MISASKRRFWHFSPKSSTFEPFTRATVDVPGASVAPAAWVDRNEPSFRRFAVYGPPNTANLAQNADFGMQLHAHRRDHRFHLGSGSFPPRGSVPARAAFYPPPYLPTGALKLKFTTRPTYLPTRVSYVHNKVATYKSTHYGRGGTWTRGPFHRPAPPIRIRTACCITSRERGGPRRHQRASSFGRVASRS